MSASDRSASTLWILLLTATSVLATLALACATPFTALAALAATRMRPRDGVATLVLTWLASQAVGFGVLHYPRDPRTLAWGIGLGSAAVAAVVAAQVSVTRVRRADAAGGVLVAYGAATLAFKAVIVLWSLALGGVATALSPAIAGRQFVRDGAILVGLLLLYRGLVAAGLPAAPRRRLHAAAAC